jgi:hypothetical protein
MMDSYEVYQRYLNAKKRFNEELNAIQKAYISSNYKFKEGDIVKIKGDRLESFTDYLYVEKIFFYEHRDYPTDENYLVVAFEHTYARHLLNHLMIMT